MCDALAVPMTLARVQVDNHSGLGLEAAARAARHTAFADAMAADDMLVLAHHQDDQAETFLLRALRGSGVDGLAAMRDWRAFAHGWLWRPLLNTSRTQLQALAQREALHWIDDPSNADTGFDRNFLRNQVLPMLHERWPQAAAAFARSAALCSDTAQLLHADDSKALAEVAVDAHTLRVTGLLQLAPSRRARVLRHWIATLQLPPLPGNGIARIESDLLPAPRDANARFEWNDACVQRWRDLLHADHIRPPLALDFSQLWDGTQPLQLPHGDRLQLIGAAHFDTPLRVHARQGGERIHLPGRRHSHALKQVLQAAGMPPWQRQRLPLLSADNTLLAAGDGLVSAQLHAWLQAHTAQLHWTQLA
jgi:tRNA(Ile)-lysidine synthase